MSFKRNEFQQINLFDSAYSISERNKSFLKKTWAFGFSEKVFQAINEQRFSVLYSDNPASRPNTLVNAVIGALLIKEFLGLTEEELLESILFDVRFQYAIHTTSFLEQPFSDCTFSRFRERVLSYEQETGIDLLKEEIYALSDIFWGYFDSSPSVKRMDSIMIASACKVMSRLELFYTCVANAVKALHRLGCEDYLASMSSYLEESYKNEVIYRCKPEQAKEKLQQTAEDGARIVSLLSDKEAV